MSRPLHKSVRRTLPLASFLMLLGLWAPAQPVSAQVLVPYTPELDFELLEEQGLILAQEATQLAQFQQYDLALARAQLASQLVPQNADVWGLLGSLYLQVEEYDDAVSALKKAQSLNPENSSVLFALGSTYFRMEEYTTAADYIQQGLKIEPDTPGALFDLGNAYYKLQRYDDAISAYEDAVDKDEEFWPAVNNIGLVLYEMNQVDEALEKWEDSVAIASEEAEPQLAIAVALYAQGQQQAGIDQAIDALTLDSRYADIQFLRDNLWGEALIADTEQLLNTPQIQDLLSGALTPEETAPAEPAAEPESNDGLLDQGQPTENQPADESDDSGAEGLLEQRLERDGDGGGLLEQRR
ncbi:MAG: tetratricopeptide repeat protein [Thainema sp.]